MHKLTRRKFHTFSLSNRYPEFKFVRIKHTDISDIIGDDIPTETEFYIYMRHNLVSGIGDVTERNLQEKLRYCLSDEFDSDNIEE